MQDKELWAALEKIDVPPGELEQGSGFDVPTDSPTVTIDSLGESLRKDLQKDLTHRMLKDDVIPMENYRYLPMVMPEFPVVPCFDIGDFECVTVPTVFYNRARMLYSLKTKRKWQRRLDWSSNVRRAKRTVELQKRALGRLLTPDKE